jgi:hypothetical protein
MRARAASDAAALDCVRACTVSRRRRGSFRRGRLKAQRHAAAVRSINSASLFFCVHSFAHMYCDHVSVRVLGDDGEGFVGGTVAPGVARGFVGIAGARRCLAESGGFVETSSL